MNLNLEGLLDPPPDLDHPPDPDAPPSSNSSSNGNLSNETKSPLDRSVILDSQPLNLNEEDKFKKQKDSFLSFHEAANSDESFTSIEDNEIFSSPIKYISPPSIKLSSNKIDDLSVNNIAQQSTSSPSKFNLNDISKKTKVNNISNSSIHEPGIVSSSGTEDLNKSDTSSVSDLLAIHRKSNYSTNTSLDISSLSSFNGEPEVHSSMNSSLPNNFSLQPVPPKNNLSGKSDGINNNSDSNPEILSILLSDQKSYNKTSPSNPMKFSLLPEPPKSTEDSNDMFSHIKHLRALKNPQGESSSVPNNCNKDAHSSSPKSKVTEFLTNNGEDDFEKTWISTSKSERISNMKTIRELIFPLSPPKSDVGGNQIPLSSPKSSNIPLKSSPKKTLPQENENSLSKKSTKEKTLEKKEKNSNVSPPSSIKRAFQALTNENKTLEISSSPPPKKMKIQNSSSTNLTYLASSDVPSNTFFGFKFILTGLKKDANSECDGISKLSALIQENGGIVLEDIDIHIPVLFLKCKFTDISNVLLIADKEHRTVKYLYALAKGILPLHYHWVKHCIQRKCILPYQAYCLPSGISLITNEAIFINQFPIQPLFQGLKIFIMGSIEFKFQWKIICEAAGATILTQYKSDSELDLLISSEIHESKLKYPNCTNILSPEYIVHCLIYQKLLDPNQHSIFRPTK